MYNNPLAANLCNNLTIGSYSDWFLPSRYELAKMFQIIGNIGGFTGGFYWSSTEWSQTRAYDYLFQGNTSGIPGTSEKSQPRNVRAIRAF
jgi:hypothetical protein